MRDMPAKPETAARESSWKPRRPLFKDATAEDRRRVGQHRMANFVVHGSRYFIMTLGPLLVVFCLLLITFCAAVYFTEVDIRPCCFTFLLFLMRPRSQIYPTLARQLGTFLTNIITIPGLWIVGNTYFNFIMAVWRGPGFCEPEEITEQTARRLERDPNLRGSERRKFCQKCTCSSTNTPFYFFSL